jgi:membrane-associated PAP2 superfamily phosphatase
MHTQLAETLTKTNSVGNDPATARESSKLVRPAKAPNRPSGGFLAYLLTRIAPAHFPRRAAIALLAGLVLLIGFSRIYLGVHFMSDVIGGYAAGAV